MRNQLKTGIMILPLMAAVLLAGCVVGPDHVSPKPSLSQDWSNGKAHAGVEAPSAWWNSLKDPSLDRLVARAMERNLDLEASRVVLQEARATYREVAGSSLPQIDGTGSASRAKSSTSGGISSAFQVGSSASWEVDLFGGVRRNREASRYAADAALQDLRAARVLVAADVVTNYVNARGYQARVALAYKTAASQKTTLALTKTKFEAGAASELDVVNAEAQVATTEAGIPVLEAAYAQSVHRIGVLLGEEPGSVVAMMKKVAPVPSAPRLPKLGIPADVVSARPDVQAAERRLGAATARVGVARAARYPSVSLTGAISTSASRVGDLAKSSTIGWQFGPSLSVPLFDGGRLAAGEDAALARKDGAFVAYRQSVLDAMEEIENSLVSISAQRRKTSKLHQAVASSVRVTEMTRSSYEMGASDFLDVVAAQRSQYAAEDGLISSRIALVVDYVTLNKALGGGWADGGEKPK